MPFNVAPTTTCPTCGLPSRVFLIASAATRCPDCRRAWEAAHVALRWIDDEELAERSVGDLV